jgi:hypothetical protein
MHQSGELYLNGEQLTALTIPDTVTQIPNYAFYGCTSLTSVEIGDGVTDIGYGAFSSCTSLISVEIGDSVTDIAYNAFDDCVELVEVVNHSSLNLTVGSTSWGYVAYNALEVHSGESKIINTNGYIFYPCNGVNYLIDYRGTDTDMVLPANCNGQNYEIYKYAFYDKNDITSITIPETVRKIHKDAFGQMPNLNKVIFNATYCADMTFSPFAEVGSDGFSVEFGAKVLKIPSHLFYQCNVTSVSFADNCICTEIGSYAFYDCDDFVTFVVPDCVTTIGARAFYNCDNLSSVTIGSAVNSIGSSAFYACYKLAEVINKSSLNIRAGYSDYGNYGYLGYYAIEVHKGESKLIIKDDYLFYCAGGAFLVNYYGNESDLLLPTNFNGYTNYSIWKYAFYDDSLTSVVIPEGVIAIENYAFAGCTSLTNVVIPNSVTSIGTYAFQNCTSLTSVEIGDGVTSIGSYAFDGCSGLESINIGSNVTSIGSSAFRNCTKLKIVYLESPTIANALTSATACGNLINKAETILIKKSITNISTFVFAVYSYTEELNYDGTDYVSYSLHIHTWEDCSVDRIPCVQDGFIGSKCTICGVVKGNTDANSAFGHDMSAATCTEPSKCQREDCNYTVGTALGHSWINATCAAPQTCSVCGATEGSTLEHTWTNATCTTPQTCSVCNATEGSALGHTWTNATCTTPQTCSVCSATEGSALGHSWDDVVTKEPTSEETGIRLYTCTICGEQRIEEIPAITYIVGDIDGNEDITSSDAVYLLMYTFFPEDYPVSQESDFNADGEVNSADAVYLLMYTFFPEDYPLEHESTPALLSFRKREDE